MDPETAFIAFTEELDLWWVRGPINHWSGGRHGGHAVRTRCRWPPARNLRRVNGRQPGAWPHHSVGAGPAPGMVQFGGRRRN